LLDVNAFIVLVVNHFATLQLLVRLNELIVFSTKDEILQAIDGMKRIIGLSNY